MCIHALFFPLWALCMDRWHWLVGCWLEVVLIVVGLWIDVCFSKGDACAFLCLFAGCWGVDTFMMIGKRGWAKKKR
jgi:hypothetical protein